MAAYTTDRYKILRDDDLDGLEDQVNAAILEGWVMCGGLTAQVNPPLYMQTMCTAELSPGGLIYKNPYGG